MQKLLESSFTSPIWRLVPSSDTTTSWVVETRTAQSKSVDYYFLKPKVSPIKLDIGLDWWSGIEGVNGKWIAFHGFVQEDLPFHKGITVVNGETGKIAWQEESLTYEFMEKEKLWAKIPSSTEQVIVLDLSTGKELEERNPLPLQKESEMYTFFQDHPHFLNIIEFVKNLTTHTPLKMVEYQETPQQVILSYFIQNAKLVDNYLLVTDHNGQIVLHTLLTKSQKGIGKGTFLVSNGFLSFVQDKHHLVVYKL